MIFKPSEEKTFEYKGMPRGSKWPIVLELMVHKMFTKGCIGYLANIVDTKTKVNTTLSDMHVFCKFPDVILEDLPGLPLDREIEFEI